MTQQQIPHPQDDNGSGNGGGGIPLLNTSHNRRKIVDISYTSQSEAQKLDIYWPADTCLRSRAHRRMPRSLRI